MSLFSPYLVDESRKKKALGGDLTPFQVRYENQSARFVGSSGEIYDTTLDGCTCADFSINLGMSGCCKHMIRLAMELGLYDKTGMVSDPDAAKVKYYMGVLRTFIHEAPLDKAADAQQIIDSIGSARVSTSDDALSFAGIPSLLDSGLFTTKGAKAKIVPTKRTAKELDGLKRALFVRLGEMTYDNISYEPISNLIKNYSAF